MIDDFEQWSAPRTDTNVLSDLSGCAIAIEADSYLDRLLNNSAAKEPLLPALGGTPFSIRIHLESELETFRQNGIKPVFIFSGLDVGKAYTPFARGDVIASNNASAWDQYNQHQAAQAVRLFGESGYASARRFYTLSQQILREQNVAFQVAPYSALGQLAYLEKNAPDYVDAIAGCSELLLYDVDRVITSFDFQNAEYTFVRRQQCLEELNLGHSELFTDACLLSGCSLLPTLPSLSPARAPKIRQVAEMLKANIQPGSSVYAMLEKDQRNTEADYIHRYKQGRLAVKHDVVLSVSGKAEPLAQEDVPNDLHDIIGQRLPDELYYYLSVGAVGTRILNQLTSARIYENCPADGGESEVYKSLVSERVTNLRALSLALLAFRLHRAYHHREIELSTWYAPDRTTQISLNEQGDPNDAIKDWRIPEFSFPKDTIVDGSDVSLTSAMKAATDTSFPSISDETSKSLQSAAELEANSIWRFLYFRGYLDQSRKLTPWGIVLSTMISSSPQPEVHGQSLLLATELLKLDLLTSENMFPSYTGAPMHGSETDKANSLLLSRVACLGTLHHKTIGFTGPLSRHLLGYNCAVEAVRASLRDLVEISLVSLLLTGHAERERDDLTDVAMHLPFLLPMDCALGIAMKHYLDDVNAAAASNGGVTPEIRDEVKAKVPRELILHAVSFDADLEATFQLWDAIYAGVKVACEKKLLAKNDQAYWDGVDQWVQERR
ncbi:MAG: hypothetical protein Q9159_003419 [Coniocarpon cinnabarinum]